MFDELNKYKNKGHFFLEAGKSLSKASASVPNEPGVYYIVKLANNKIELVYIGQSGTMQLQGTFKDKLLRSEINNKQGGIKSQSFFEQKFAEENIDALDIYWVVTIDGKHNDLPDFVEGVLMQAYYELHGTLPPWNTRF